MTEDTPLTAKIRTLIERTGPLTLADYMQLCLFDPKLGYYVQGDAIGRSGDFITAPEISQMFGELAGIWLVSVWNRLGRPSPFNLVEFGPGTGTLMQDMQRGFARFPDFAKSFSTYLVEASPAMKGEQQRKLGSCDIRWSSSLDEVPTGPMLAIGNEFLDCLPFRQYVRSKDHWLELGVGVAESGQFEFVALPSRLGERSVKKDLGNPREGDIFEISPAREAFVETLASRIANEGGAALFFDYGHVKSGLGDTFQAIRDHQPVDPLLAPGKADLTSHVDFAPLEKLASKMGCPTVNLTTQGEFLLQMGLLERAGAIGRDKGVDVQSRLREEVERLAAPNAMGKLFKAFAFASETITLPGFERIAQSDAH